MPGLGPQLSKELRARAGAPRRRAVSVGPSGRSADTAVEWVWGGRPEAPSPEGCEVAMGYLAGSVGERFLAEPLSMGFPFALYPKFQRIMHPNDYDVSLA